MKSGHLTNDISFSLSSVSRLHCVRRYYHLHTYMHSSQTLIFVNTADMYDMSGALIRDVPLCSSRLPQAAALDGGSVINWLTASDAAPSAVYSP